MHPIKICCPGQRFRYHYIKSITELIAYFHYRGWDYSISNFYSKNIYHSRNACLWGDPENSKKQLPFLGSPYSYILWIDDDISFTPRDFEILYNSDKDFVSGLYLQKNGVDYTAVEKWDEKYFKKFTNFEFLNENILKQRDELIKVAYTGLGFSLIKQGVIEQLSYPWFEPVFSKIGNCYDFSSEDAGLCLKCQEKNIDIYVNKNCRVIHHKTIPII